MRQTPVLTPPPTPPPSTAITRAGDKDSAGAGAGVAMVTVSWRLSTVTAVEFQYLAKVGS